ncbi:MAG: response regulator transcription factor [Lachnospiraceae bacterium]|nr:response regulator transcription factor [Lachnospiraceae bacterium]
MVKIALVDDDTEQLETLQSFIRRYMEEKGETIEAVPYRSGVDFLSEYKANFDIVFLDIEMPGTNGMETAREVRNVDQSVVIVFITQMAQYAIKGYEVNAVDFVLKPVNYFQFSTKLDKAIAFSAKRAERTFMVTHYDEVYKLRASEVYYIEKDKNYLVFHAKEGDFTCRGTITEYEKELAPIGFAKPINGCLVNLFYVTQIKEGLVCVNKDIYLPISRTQKKAFMKECLEYFSRGK